MLTIFPKLMKELLKPLPKNDYLAVSTFSFVSCRINFALDKSIVNMRDLRARLKMQGINVNTLRFFRFIKIRERESFEKIIIKLKKSLVYKKIISIRQHIIRQKKSERQKHMKKSSINKKKKKKKKKEKKQLKLYIQLTLQ